MDVMNMATDVNDIDSKSNGGRTPKCTRCRNHGVVSDLRGHKYKCYWRTCTCPKCLISCHKQRETADRIALFRQQVRESKDMDKTGRKMEPEEEQRRTEELQKFIVNNAPGAMDPKRSPTSTHIHESQMDYYSDGRSSFDSARWKENSSNIKLDTIEDKNLAILKYLFPFYDINILKVLVQSCRNDVLETVLSISARIMEERQHMSPAAVCKPHFPSSLSGDGFEKCCDSLLCPVNSYIELRMKGSIQPSTTLVSNYSSVKRYAGNCPDSNNIPYSKKRFVPSYDSDGKSTVPFCASCNRYGLSGDKFCPLCGVQY